MAEENSKLPSLPEEDTDMREINNFLDEDNRPNSTSGAESGQSPTGLPLTPISSNNSSRANTPTTGEASNEPGSDPPTAVRRRVGKVYPPKPAAAKRDLLMSIDFHQISTQVITDLL